MNPTRDEILRELFVMVFKAVQAGEFITVNDTLKYDEQKDFSDPLSIPTRGFVDYLIASGGGGGGGSSVVYRTFTIPVGTSAPFGELSIDGMTNDQGDEVIPSNPVSTVYDNNSAARYKLDKTIVGLEVDESDLTVNEVMVALVGGEDQPVIVPNLYIYGMNFGTKEAFQSFLISKGNTGANVTHRVTIDGFPEYEGFLFTGVPILADSTFEGQSDLTRFNLGGGVNGIGANCFKDCVNLYECVLFGLEESSTSIGGTVGLNGVFENTLPAIAIQTQAYFSTVNAGVQDGDFQYVIDNGGSVIYT